MKNRILITIVLFCLFSTVFWAQSTAEPPQKKSEVNFWEIFGMDIQVHKIFKIYLEKQLRYRETFSDLRADIMEAGVRILLYKRFYFRTNYRYVIRENTKRYRFDANLQLNLKVKLFPKKKQPLRLSLRTRIQQEYIKSNSMTRREYEWRNRVKFSYQLKKQLEPFLGFEVFRGLGDNSKHLHKLRLSMGVEWKPKKRFSIKAYYHFQEDMVADLQEKAHIFATKFNYSF